MAARKLMAKTVPKSKRSANTSKTVVAKTTQPAAVLSPTKIKKVPNVWRLTKQPANLLWMHKRLFAGITLIYAFLNVILAQGLTGSNASLLKDQLSQAVDGNVGGLGSSLLVFSGLLSSAGSSTSATASTYQLFLGLIASLAIIWALRHVVAGKTLRIRDSFYKGMTPLVPFIFVLLIIGLQLLPMALGSSLYAIVSTQGIAVQAVEKIIWAAVLGILTLWSLYMLSASVFGLYIVTLPEMTPLKALRSAKQLVRGRRWIVLRKLLFLPLLLLLLAAVVMVPFILFFTAAATYVFFLLTTFALVAIHSYIYNLYRELLDE